MEKTKVSLDGGSIELSKAEALIRCVVSLGLRPDPWLNGEEVPTYEFAFYEQTLDPDVYKHVIDCRAR